MTQPRLGGSFAPPCPPEKLVTYRTVAASASPEIKEAMLALCDMVALFQQTPRSTLPGKPHPVGIGLIVPLAEAEVKRIWDAVPWKHECEMYQRLFDAIPAEQKDLRDASFHLLWFAVELEKDREPLTADLL